KGVKADGDEASTWGEESGRMRKQRLHFLEFTVYEHTESLEGAGGWMNLPFAGLIHGRGSGRHDFRKMCSVVYRPRPDNGSGDSPRPPFLTEFVNHIGECLLVEVVYHLIGRSVLVRVLVHAHVERAICSETESARCVVELN